MTSAVQQAVKRQGRPTAPDAVPSFFRATVTEVRSDGMVWVLIPRLSGETPIGPMPAASYKLTVGERVMVGAVEDSRGDLMIICREYGDSSAFPAFQGVHLADPPTGPDNAVRKDYADALGSITADPNTITRRGASGSILVQEAYLGGVQTANNAATRKSYVDAGDTARLPKNPTLLPQTAHDLNDYQTPDIYHQSFNATAAISANYPVPLAGLCEVFSPSTSFIYQRYTVYNTTTRMFWRAKYSTGAFGGWKEVQDVATVTTLLAGKANSVHTHAASDITSGVFAAALLPAATSAAQGAMSAADKAKLDAAGPAATANTLVMLDAAGRAKVANPSATTDIANKTYVDTGLAGKSDTGHTHSAADINTGTLSAARLPAASSSTAGSMSAADKIKLDAASAAATASTLVMLDAAGRAQVAAPSVAADIANKSYVDTQVATKANTSHMHTYADITGTVPTAALPPLAVNDVFTVGTQAAMLALTAQRGDMAIRSDNGKTYALSTDSPGTLADWKELMATGQVVSVAGQTGTVVLAKGDVGLGNVDNTSDASKPVSTATQTALNGKANTSHTHLWADLTDKPTTFTPSAHTHSAADLTSGTVPVARLPLATSAANGAMSAADKAILDAATISATGSTLALRNSTGDLTATNYYMPSGQAQSALPQSLTRRDYVDGVAAGKANTSHTHAAADITSGTLAAARLPLATTSANGAMSAADKTTLDAISDDTGWVNVTLTAPWVNYDTGVHATSQVRRIGQRVEYKAFIKTGSLGTNVAVLPAGYRPVSQRWFPVMFQSASIGATFGVVYPDGTVYVAGTGAVTYLSIEVSFLLG
ncbi:minor tail protein [Arthrobacter phage KBurrousTX]|uniref:Minor tail protein n=1 Tax=Arthrobacter phage KBurrousTX TaxID=2315608 RepID=A0A386KBA6_9CAUD|nr:minor tail protein [Arthrobacter phage KBurrousTX]AYD81520.1 minor tail protein [Arthrobacter phage KBurrousTX]